MARAGAWEQRPHLALGVSGGPDSMALAVLARDWAAANGGRVSALHVDHGLRAGSAAEAEKVGGWLSAHDVPCTLLHWSGTKPAANLMAAARDARYALLADWCHRQGVLHLLVAHHRDDQAETLVQRLARGSGLDGLTGMAPVATMPFGRLLRPLLEAEKRDLHAFLEQRGIASLSDPSNRDLSRQRARARRFIEGLSRDVEPGEPLVRRLSDSAAHLSRAQAAIEAMIGDLAARAVGVDRFGRFRLSLGSLAEAPDEVRLRLLGRLVAAAGGAQHMPRFDRLNRLNDWIGSRGTMTLGGSRIGSDGHSATIFRESRRLPESAPMAESAGTRWDGRFIVDLVPAAGARARGLFIAPLGAEGWRQIRERGPAPAGAPAAAVRATQPALWRRDRLIGAPTLGWWRDGTPLASATFAPARPLSGVVGPAAHGRADYSVNE